MAAIPETTRATDLYERYASRIFGYCLHRLGSREEAEDAVQTTFLNAFRSLSRGVVPGSESAWLFKIAENVCLSRHRASFRRRRVESPADLRVVEETVAAPARPDEELIPLEDALADMPETQRRALLLREWQGLSYREIAAELAARPVVHESAPTAKPVARPKPVVHTPPARRPRGTARPARVSAPPPVVVAPAPPAPTSSETRPTKPKPHERQSVHRPPAAKHQKPKAHDRNEPGPPQDAAEHGNQGGEGQAKGKNKAR